MEEDAVKFHPKQTIKGSELRYQLCDGVDEGPNDLLQHH